MNKGARYRILSVVGTAAAAVVAVLVANRPAVQNAVAATTAWLPVVNELDVVTMASDALTLAVATTLVVVVATLSPMFKPQPRRTSDLFLRTQRRVLVACFALATIGYFDYTYRLPRSTMIVAAGVLLVVVPGWFLLIGRQPTERAVVVGDDPDQIARVIEGAGLPLVGYVSPPIGTRVGESRAAADGGNVSIEGVDYLGGLSRLDDALVRHDVNTAVLAFSETDRGEFFGALNECNEHGVHVKVPEEHADPVLEKGTLNHSGLVDVDLQPWDWQDRLLKRVFDVAFALTGLLVTLPVTVVIAVAIKLESDGPVLYSQERTAEFGDTFPIYKFRTMLPESEDAAPGEDENRVTRVGRLLRRTHLDEIPQLLSILAGDMSVVGPRAAWTAEERILEGEVSSWPQRWFVKPGLTGLAQIRDVTSSDPTEKLRYDIEYVRNQSFWYDVRIVVIQVYEVASDFLRVVARRDP